MTFFTTSLKDQDADVFASVEREYKRQKAQIELIASENLTYKSVLEAQGSVLTNKYAEGYPSKRYYGGCEYVDEIEALAQERVKKLFNVKFANVQPHSGSQANQAVFNALLKPGDAILGMSLDQGGHLTHGSPVNQSGKWFDAHFYGVSKEDECLDYDAMKEKALEVKPKIIIAGASAYARFIDFKKCKEIADSVGAYLMVDMAHIAGLIAAGVHPSPVPYADVITSTTHKTLRGPRGGLVLTNDEKIAKKINSAIFPGIQGGPLMHVIAGKAVAFGIAQTEDYKNYMRSVVENSKMLCQTCIKGGLRAVSGGTDNHLMMLDLRPLEVTGKAAEITLENAGLTCNKNAIPFDDTSPFITSGIRLGSAAGTARGFGKKEFEQIGQWIVEILVSFSEKGVCEEHTQVENKIKENVEALCKEFPIYKDAF